MAKENEVFVSSFKELCDHLTGEKVFPVPEGTKEPVIEVLTPSDGDRFRKARAKWDEIDDY